MSNRVTPNNLAWVSRKLLLRTKDGRKCSTFSEYCSFSWLLRRSHWSSLMCRQCLTSLGLWPLQASMCCCPTTSTSDSSTSITSEKDGSITYLWAYWLWWFLSAFFKLWHSMWSDLLWLVYLLSDYKLYSLLLISFSYRKKLFRLKLKIFQSWIFYMNEGRRN